MLAWLPIVKGIVTHPLQTFEEVADRYTWHEAVPYYLIVGLVGWSVDLVRPQPSDTEGSAILAAFNSPFFPPLLILLGPLLTLPSVLLLYWAGRRQGGQGPWTRLYTTELVNGGTVTLLNLPLLLLINAELRLTGQGEALATLDSIAVLLWGFVLTYFSIRASLRLERRGAINTIIIAIAIGFAIVVVFSCGLAIFTVGRQL